MVGGVRGRTVARALDRKRKDPAAHEQAKAGTLPKAKPAPKAKSKFAMDPNEPLDLAKFKAQQDEAARMLGVGVDSTDVRRGALDTGDADPSDRPMKYQFRKAEQPADVDNRDLARQLLDQYGEDKCRAVSGWWKRWIGAGARKPTMRQLIKQRYAELMAEQEREDGEVAPEEIAAPDAPEAPQEASSGTMDAAKLDALEIQTLLRECQAADPENYSDADVARFAQNYVTGKDRATEEAVAALRERAEPINYHVRDAIRAYLGAPKAGEVDEPEPTVTVDKKAVVCAAEGCTKERPPQRGRPPKVWKCPEHAATT
jgi:predicted RNA-binding Zn ribbon-like protein